MDGRGSATRMNGTVVRFFLVVVVFQLALGAAPPPSTSGGHERLEIKIETFI